MPYDDLEASSRAMSWKILFALYRYVFFYHLKIFKKAAFLLGAYVILLESIPSKGMALALLGEHLTQWADLN